MVNFYDFVLTKNLFLQIEKTLVQIIQSDRFWTDLQNIVKTFEPCLFILRLADKECPAMDQLYFYVRKMDTLVSTLKETLNQTEDKYSRQTGPNIESKLMNYFLRSKDKHDVKGFLSSNNDLDEDDDSDDESTLGNDLMDDMESDFEPEDTNEPEDNRCGTILERAWVRRSKALRTDIAIAGWMCSPHPEIMEDCSTNNKGEHRLPVTRLLRKWYSHKVRLLFYLFISLPNYTITLLCHSISV